jgi:putative transposase
LLGNAANERVQKLLEEDSPTQHGWLRSRWSCKLIALQLLEGAGHYYCEPGDASPRSAQAGLPLEERAPRPARKSLPGADREEKRARLEEIQRMTDEAGSLFQDETKLETNSKVGLCWMRKGKQRLLPTPGTNRKAWVSGALNFATGRFHWVLGERKKTICSSGCSISCEAPTAATGRCTWPWTTTQAIPANGSTDMWRPEEDRSVCIPYPRAL